MVLKPVTETPDIVINDGDGVIFTAGYNAVELLPGEFYKVLPHKPSIIKAHYTNPHSEKGQILTINFAQF